MNLSLEQWALVLTAGAAWAGFGLSLYNLVQSRPRRRVKVIFSSHPELEIEYIVVIFINERGSTVQIGEVGFQRADGSKIAKVRWSGLPHEPQLPTEVPPGHRACYYFELEELRSGVQERKPIPVRAYCRDDTDQYHKSPNFGREIRSAFIG